MERYSEYKDSGIQWLGEIPSHWEVVPFKMISSIILGKMLENALDGLGEKYLCAKDVHMNEINFHDLKRMLFSEDEKKKYEVKKGDMLVVEGGASGSSAIVNTDVCNVFIQNSIMIVRCHNNVAINAYASYCLNSMVSRGYADCVCNKATIMHFTKEKLGSTFITVPPITEQQAIASYLDSTTAKIDEAIAQQQKMIDLLNERKQIIINNAVTKGLNPDVKMKDSGVDWIGEIPEGWKISSLKHYCRLTNGDRGPNYPSGDDIKDSGVFFATADNIHGFEIEVKESSKFITEEKYKILRGAKLKKGDIIFCLRGAGFGNCAINNMFEIGTIASSLVNITPININNEFLNFTLHSSYVRTQEIVSSNGSCADNVSAQDLGDYLILIPTNQEQMEIVSLIKNSIRPIDILISKSNQQISLLQERKQIIINDVVTGKVKVL